MKSGLNVITINIKGMEDFKRCSDNVVKSAQQLEEAVQELNECQLTIDACSKLENVGGCEKLCSTPFCREDLEDIISDLQEEYYRLGQDNVLIKIQIADSIDRLCRLRNTLLM
jgi:uncharacterized protein Yka (UPF0111/DUF47 family)